MSDHGTDDDATTARTPTAKYAHLPPRVRPEEMVEEQPAEPPHDPDGGRDPETDFMLRYSS